MSWKSYAKTIENSINFLPKVYCCILFSLILIILCIILYIKVKFAGISNFISDYASNTYEKFYQKFN